MEPIRGVPLVQLAAVHAAVAEGFALGDVLAAEGLPEVGWFEAELSWKRRLVEDADTFAAYEEELTQHQRRLGRRVKPIDEDLEQWVAFLRLYGDHPVPFDFLAGLNLELPDLTRLSTLWTARFDGEPRLAKKAEKLAGKLEKRAANGQLIELKPIEVAERQLLPSSAAGGFVQVPLAIDEELATDEERAAAPIMGLDRYAALTAELRAADNPTARAMVLNRFELDKKSATEIEEAWRPRLEADDQLRADFRALCRHYGASISRRGDAPPGPPPPAAPRVAPEAPHPMSLERPSTAAMPAFRPGTPMPFHGQVTSVAIHLPVPPSTRDPLDATGDLIPALLDEQANPFNPRQQGPVDSTGELRMDQVGLDTLPFDEDAEGILAALASIPDFDEPHEAVGLTATLTTEELGTDTLPFDDLDGTAALDVEQLGTGEDALPFSDKPSSSSAVASRPSAADLAPHEAAGATAAFAAVPSSPDAEPATLEASTLDGTAFLAPLDLGDLDEDDAEDEEGTEPTQRLRAKHAPAPTPRLTLDQFASFNAELAVHPARAAQIRARYHLADEEAQKRLEAFWHARFASYPAEQRSYRQKLAHFRAWLLAHPRG